MGVSTSVKPTAKPAIDERPVEWSHANDRYRMHWYGQPGHQADSNAWTRPELLDWTIDELTVHWSEGNTPMDRSDEYYLQMLHEMAIFHAFTRNWGSAKNFVRGDTIMYHYAVTPRRIVQLTAETRRTWNAKAANSRNISIMMMAGHGNAVSPQMVKMLERLLDWFVTSRPDLPLITPFPRTMNILSPDGTMRSRTSKGVLTHDESLKLQGEPTKGCAGIYSPYVQRWRSSWQKLMQAAA